MTLEEKIEKSAKCVEDIESDVHGKYVDIFKWMKGMHMRTVGENNSYTYYDKITDINKVVRTESDIIIHYSHVRTYVYPPLEEYGKCNYSMMYPCIGRVILQELPHVAIAEAEYKSAVRDANKDMLNDLLQILW